MHRKMSARAALAAAILTSSCVLATAWSAAPAEAAGGSSTCQGSGGSSGGGGGSGGTFKLWLEVSSQIPSCASGGNASQSDGSSGSAAYVPCWWAPAYDPEGLQAYVQAFETTSSTDNWYTMLAGMYDQNGTEPLPGDYLSDSGPKWDSYNVKASPAGEWYGMYYNSSDTSDQLQTCNDELTALGAEQFYWADTGKQPTGTPADIPVFTAKELAEYVEGVVLLPSAQVHTSQGTDANGNPVNATVGLPIWYWQDEGTDSTKMNYDICVFNNTVCVTFTAYAVSFTIDAGTDSGHAWSDGCIPQPATNTLGPKYAGESTSEDPTCGVKYSALATGVSPTVYTKWHVNITWTSDGGGSWGPPNDPVIATPLDPFDVQDIQAYNQASPSATP